MSRNIVTQTDDEKVVQLVSSGATRSDDGTVEVYLCPEEETWTPETGLRLIEDDALALVDVLRQAVELVAGHGRQRFIRLRIREIGD